MATKIGDLFFDVYADATKALKNIDDFAAGAVRAGSAAARAIGETVANAVALTTGATALLVATTLNAGVAYNTLGQSATAAFSSIYGNVSAAHEVLQQISTLDLETPFKGSALTATARTLAGFGFQLSDVVDTTQALAQATAAMGLGSDALHRMAIAFGQIQSRGKLAGDEARQLANYGIDAYGLLAEKMQLSVAAVRELGQEGKLTSDFVIPALVDAIETRFAGATEKLFNTAAGQAEGLRSIMEGVGSALVQPFIGFSGGGAIVSAMSVVRESLLSVVEVAEDGSFRLTGFLEPLAPIMSNLAIEVRDLAGSFAGFLSGLDENSLTDLMVRFEGLSSLLVPLGAGLIATFARAIPFLGRFFVGFNPIVVAIGTLIAMTPDLRDAFVDAFMRISETIGPIVPRAQELIDALVETGLIESSLNLIATGFEILVPYVLTATDAVTEFIDVAGPVLSETLDLTVMVLTLLNDLLGGLGNEIVVMTGVVLGLAYAFPTLTLAIQLSTTAIGASGVAATIANSAFLTLATTIGVALAALGSYNAVSAGIKGDVDYLNRDVPFYEKPFQLAGRASFALFGGDRGAAREEAEFEAAREAAMDFNLALLGNVDTFGEAREQALQYGETVGVANEQLDYFANTVALAWDAARKAAIEANNTPFYEFPFTTTGSDFIGPPAPPADWLADTEEAVDLMKELKGATDAAWEAVERLGRAGSSATVDDFLRGLPDLAEELTDALAETPGLLRDLNVSGVLGDVRSNAVKLIQSMAEEYRLSVGEVKALLDQRGLAGVIEEMGKITTETTKTVDPLVVKYASLGATAEQLRDAISRLNDVRQTAIRAQIDQVTAALDDAKAAADAAREAFEAYFLGSTGGLQGAIDKLTLGIPDIGSQIEDGLLRGGPQGEAMIRQALNGAGTQLSEIFRLGLEQGLAPQQIIDMLGPVYGSISQELSGALGRIQTLDWTEGFTPKAAGEIQAWFAQILNPDLIGQLFGNIGGADSRVSALESQLENLKAQLNLDVEFSPEQVQEALAEIKGETTVEAVITPEAAQMVYDEIQDVFNDDDLIAAVDQALITQQIMDAAQAAEDEVNLVFRSGLSFNSSELDLMARLVSEEFYRSFNQRMQELRDEEAQKAGFDSYYDLVRAVGPAVAGAIVGSTVFNQNILNDIRIDGTQQPIATAQEVIAASSAAAGTGGAYDPAKYGPSATFYPTAPKGTINSRLS